METTEQYVRCPKCGDDVPASAMSKRICLQCLEEGGPVRVWTGEGAEEVEG